ncbi:hypothetical protein FHG87_005737 [Trinorchestia longiramus]|nr:hypothetical protein FHG87_005737 [Trinorchestia longiramus]
MYTGSKIVTLLVIGAWWCGGARACRSTNKGIGVCLHVYLERDFLSLESIVYPHAQHSLRSMRYRHGEASFTRGWLEGPQLERHCVRLKDVTSCFVQILLECDAAIDFFRFRQLLHALEKVHDFLCGTPDARRERFLQFLQTVECAEKARQEQFSHTCHRHNLTANVWNKILRLEIGPEICASLSTQRACLLDDGYLQHYCTRRTQVDIYTQVSGLFLAHWCRTPLLPGAHIPHTRLHAFARSLSTASAVSPSQFSFVFASVLAIWGVFS